MSAPTSSAHTRNEDGLFGLGPMGLFIGSVVAVVAMAGVQAGYKYVTTAGELASSTAAVFVNAPGPTISAFMSAHEVLSGERAKEERRDERKERRAREQRQEQRQAR